MAQDVIAADEQFAILSETERPAGTSRVLKYGDSFAVFDAYGNIVAAPGSEHGLYHGGTRFLSRLELLLGHRQPMLLSSTISEDNMLFCADLTNLDVVYNDVPAVPRGSLHLFRTRVLCDGMCCERIRVTNHGAHALDVPITLRVDADFADVFEVRGTRRQRRGERLPDTGGEGIALAYRGLDGVERRTRISARPGSSTAGDGTLEFVLHLEPHKAEQIEVTIACETPDDRHAELRRPDRDGADFDHAVGMVRRHNQSTEAAECTIHSSSDGLNRWIQRSAADLRMMVTDTAYGPYPYAGIPWFSTPFGRDGIITALELLWMSPEIARGVLTYLAATQATELNDAQDAQPGKIVHEIRSGEMAALGEIPFGRYYGTVDATPLFVMLAAAYFERTADFAFLDRLWPNVLAALEWMDAYGDVDGDGFIEYARRSATGLVNQGWKDSYDSVFHEDGALAAAPIALCEVQGYAYAAWLGAAALARARGDDDAAQQWARRADDLRGRFDRSFWCEHLGTYALALDADKRPCRIVTSNAGHCLFTGIVPAARAGAVARALVADASFSGWGVRTVAAGPPRYNPMSYHNGSVWPHDNAVIAAGLARYGFTAEASMIMSALFDLSQRVDLNRLPELICGFHRRGDYPTLYPVACAPQAWAAGAVTLLLEACLGMRVDALERRVSFSKAALPAFVDWMRIENLTVAGVTIDLLLNRHAYDVSVTVLRRTGDVAIATLK
jgi:glycogen debranching enzyme